MGYIYSICNDDWTPAMENIAQIIEGNLMGHCIPDSLVWNFENKTSDCDAVFEFEDKCPKLNNVNWLKEKNLGAVGVNGKNIYACYLPKIKVDIKCPEKGSQEESDLEYIISNETGWFYCENEGEDFVDVCKDGQDNDGDGEIDCDDKGCKSCPGCAIQGEEDTTECPEKCKYNISFTNSAKKIAVKAIKTTIQCPLK
jgi:hypothetical protein